MATVARSVIWALRMRVNMSAMGSVMLIVRSYQLALTMPGISPRIAYSRSLLRPRPNLRKTPRGRPVIAQRLRSRVGFALRGSCCSLSRAAKRSSSEARGLSTIDSSIARLFAYFATSFSRFCWRLINASFDIAISSLAPERELERGEQRLRFGVRLRGGRDRDVHPPDRVDLVVLDLRKDDLFLDAHVVVAAAVEAASRHAAEVAHARQRDGHQAVEELVHPLLAQRHHAADRVALADLEAGDRLARLGDDGLLAADLRHVADGVVEDLAIGGGLADAHVEHDLRDARHLHRRRVAELLRERRCDFLAIDVLEPGGLVRLVGRVRLFGRGLALRRLLGLRLLRGRRSGLRRLGVLLVGSLLVRGFLVSH